MRGHLLRRHPRLFWRVYLNGILLLVLVGVALAVVGALVGRGQLMRSPERLARYAAEQASEYRAEPARLAAELRRASEAFGVEFAVYSDSGALLAASDEHFPGPIAEEDRARLSAGPVHLSTSHLAWAARVEGEVPAYVVMAAPPRTFPLSRAAAFLAAALAMLAVASIPLARAIARPLEKLTQAARRLGEGDLSARSGVFKGGEVGELSRAFDEMAGRIETLLRSERELLANVSHELRTPLSRIRVALDLASEGEVAQARRYVEEIRIDLAELERLLEDVLTAARLDLAGGPAGVEMPLRREWIEVQDLLARAQARFRGAHPGRALEVRVEGEASSLYADPVLLRRVLDNLLDNAAKYSEPPSPVELVARGDEGGLEVEVTDHGIGVDAVDIPHLFTPFFRTDRSRARGTGGVGLGLALVRSIVEAHGGTISATSSPGRGTAVRLTIPGAPP
ncbi:MAG TPA: HAMP domain-containing sensor histidine kinase [Anaeromyxobacteraceae bacterium]|nr:HAMP domain-containing sensor histidine kinase [Anaeromyxobacteraceae bacterium]